MLTVTREREMLLEHLDAQRRHVFGILAGLSDEQLRRPLLPSGWHCLGLVKHLALADEIRRSDAIIAGTDLDAPPAQRDERWASWGADFPDLRSVILHVLTETSIHAGHLDAVRELIDGRQWVVVE